MTQPVSAVWSSLSWTFARNSSAGHARQFGPQWRVSKLVCGIFNNLESLLARVVYRRGEVWLRIRPPKFHPQRVLLPSRCLHDQNHSNRRKGIWQRSFTLVLYSYLWVHSSNVPLFPTISILYLPNPSPISGFGRAAGGTVVIGTSDMAAAER